MPETIKTWKSRLTRALKTDEAKPSVAGGDAVLRVAAVNSIAMFGLGMIVVMSAVQGVMGLWTIVLSNQISTVAFIGILVLSRLGKYLAARLLLIGYLQALILVYSWLFGFGIGLGFFFYPLLTLPFVLFGTKEKGAIFFSCAMTIAAGVFLELQHEAWQIGQMSLDPSITNSMRLTYRLTSFLGIMLPPLLLFVLTERFRKQLRDEQALLVQSARLSSLGQMSSGIAHEINNPLAIIVGKSYQTLRLLKDQARPDLEKIALNLSIIQATGHRIAKIIQGLRTFSRDAVSDPKSPASIQSIVDDTLGLGQERFRTHGIELRSRSPESEALILCRPTQIVQILVNLLTNAFDAVVGTDHPWVSLAVGVEPEFIVISVTDSGPKIPAAVAEKCMEPFFTTKNVGKGTGLGLSLSKGIAEEHGGTLVLDRQAKTTRFVLRIPRFQAVSTRDAA